MVSCKTRLHVDRKPLPSSEILVHTNPNAADLLSEALRAVSRADIYWSNEFFYRWLSAVEPLSDPGMLGIPAKVAVITHPLVAAGVRFVIRYRENVSPGRRLAFLRRLTRDGHFPGAGVALARAIAKQGDFETALEVAEGALRAAVEFGPAPPDLSDYQMGQGAGHPAIASEPTRQYQLHIIENQITALHRKIAGRGVPHALNRYLGDDDGYLIGRTCYIPFERIDLQENGNCAVCCAAWMPGFSLGNVLEDGIPLSEIHNNAQAVAARQSMLDGSFKYCDMVKCPKIFNDELQTKPDEANVFIGNTKRAVENNCLEFEHPSTMLLAFDVSCNLSCPSCRRQVITEKLAMQVTKEELVQSSIVPFLKKAKVLHINPAGEIFVSRPLRRLLSRLNRQDFPDLQLAMISNGTLFNRREWEKFPGIHNMINAVRISTDASSKATFEKLRRGAQWEPFFENLCFLAELKDKAIISDFVLSMTYQADNFREMFDFVKMAHDLHPDTIVQFEKLENWGAFSADEYRTKAVHHIDHPSHEEFLSVIRRPDLSGSPRLRADYLGLLQ